MLGSPRGLKEQEEEAGPPTHERLRSWGPPNRNNVEGYGEMNVRACCCMCEGRPKGARKPAWANENRRRRPAPVPTSLIACGGPATRNNMKGYEDTIRVRVTTTNVCVWARSAMTWIQRCELRKILRGLMSLGNVNVLPIQQ